MYLTLTLIYVGQHFEKVYAYVSIAVGRYLSKVLLKMKHQFKIILFYLIQQVYIYIHI